MPKRLHPIAKLFVWSCGCTARELYTEGGELVDMQVQTCPLCNATPATYRQLEGRQISIFEDGAEHSSA